MQLHGVALIDWIAAHPVAERDAAVERWLGIAETPVAVAPLCDDGIGYHPSGVAAIVDALREARVGPDDVFVDLGAGTGKVAMLTHLLTGARVHGIEVQPDLVERARHLAAQHGLDRVTFACADAREADLHEGTVFYLYLPFTGRTLATVMARLRVEARHRPIRVCALGMELHACDWLTPRAGTAFWLTVYESAMLPRAPLDLGPHADDVANERGPL